VRRSLSREEAALWARVAQTVKPMAGRQTSAPPAQVAVISGGAAGLAGRQGGATKGAPMSRIAAIPAVRPAKERPLDRSTLDAGWDRKLARGLVQPDFTIDLHGHNLDGAHSRLDHGLALAQAQGARLVLLITGRPRPAEGNAARGERRGAIRAKFLDWLAAGPHASRIAAIRPAHPRHGGAGAVYVVLRRPSRLS
jgi:DNA-nicking Smr family endonuclease